MKKAMMFFVLVCMIIFFPNSTNAHLAAAVGLSDKRGMADEEFLYKTSLGNKDVLFPITHGAAVKPSLGEREKDAALIIIIAGLSVIFVLLFVLNKLRLSNKKVKAVLERLENNNVLQKTFIDADERLIYLKDENFKYVFVNKAFETLYKKPRNEIKGLDDYSLSESGLADKQRKTDEAALIKQKLVIEQVEWKGGIYRTVKFPVRMPNGKFGVGAYINDVTEEHENRKRQQKVLYRHTILADVITRDFFDRQEELDYVLHEALKLTESQHGYIYLYDETTEEFTLNSWTKGVMKVCAVADKKLKYQLSNTGLWGEVVRQGKPIVENNYKGDNPFKGGLPKGHVKLKNFMSVPVIMDGSIVAVVGLANKPADYDENDVYETTLLMSGVWNTIIRKEGEIELKEANRELEENKEKLQMILDSAAEAIYGVDTNGNCTFCNASCVNMLGYEKQSDLIGKNMHGQIHHSLKDGSMITIDDCKIIKALKTGGGAHIDDEMFWKRDGTPFDVEYFSYPQLKDGKIVGAVVTFLDITERKKAEESIKYLSFHDSLTGLYNRRFFEEEIRRLDTQRNLPISIIMADVNGLKLTNDIFGHAFGDELLEKITAVLRGVCRADDIIARWGGDEFILLLPNTAIDEAKVIAKRIKERFAKESVKSIKGSISVGLDVKSDMSQDIARVLSNAEEQMYTNKTLERDKLKDSTIIAIVSALHENSDREKDHAIRVSDMCMSMGRKLNLSEAKVQRLKNLGYLHDIGKIVLDPKLINKNYSLSDAEIGEMKKHASVGYRILNAFDGTINLAESVLAHHEQWNGNGYPKGLKGEEIPLAARILSIAESYDRMVHDSYNLKAKTKEEAIKEIRANAGTQFDPKLAEIFARMMENYTL
ncbi:MAG: HD domain-containing phosphohydrolase [Christensenellales bacterium]